MSVLGSLHAGNDCDIELGSASLIHRTILNDCLSENLRMSASIEYMNELNGNSLLIVVNAK